MGDFLKILSPSNCHKILDGDQKISVIKKEGHATFFENLFMKVFQKHMTNPPPPPPPFVVTNNSITI